MGYIDMSSEMKKGVMERRNQKPNVMQGFNWNGGAPGLVGIGGVLGGRVLGPRGGGIPHFLYRSRH